MKPKCVPETLKYIKSKNMENIFPNISTILSVLILVTSTSATVERATPALRSAKTQVCSMVHTKRSGEFPY